MLIFRNTSWYVVLAGLLVATVLPTLADENFLQQGINDFNAGSFDQAVGHLGEALATGFNNPTLHYYLACSYIRLKRRDDAIREYRIAYALQPSGELGRFSMSALRNLGVQPAGTGAQAVTKLQESATPVIPYQSASHDDRLEEQRHQIILDSDRQLAQRKGSRRSHTRHRT